MRWSRAPIQKTSDVSHCARCDGFWWGADQAEMLELLCRSGNGVSVIVGPAGTGKTYGVTAAKEAWQASGYEVIGCAHAGKAADVLGDEAQLDGTITIDARFLKLDNPRSRFQLTPRHVLIVDESEMAGTERFARLLAETAKTGTKLVLIGDPSQLPSIDAGGPLQALTNRVPHVVLVENRRQRQVWERQAVSDLRNAHTVEALKAYDEHGRISYSLNADDRDAAMLGDWQQQRSQGASVLMMSGRNVDVSRLNTAAQTMRRNAGELGPIVVAHGANQFHEGDRDRVADSCASSASLWVGVNPCAGFSPGATPLLLMRFSMNLPRASTTTLTFLPVSDARERQRRTEQGNMPGAVFG